MQNVKWLTRITLLEQHSLQLRERSLSPPEGASVEEMVRASIASYFEFVEKDPFLFRMVDGKTLGGSAR